MELTNQIDRELSIEQKRLTILAKENRSSSWLTAMVIGDHGFFLNDGILYISGMAGTYRMPHNHVSVVPSSLLIMQ